MTCLQKVSRMALRLHPKNGPTRTAANASTGTVIVCKFKISAYPPAPLLSPSVDTAAGPINIERSTYVCSVHVHRWFRPECGRMRTLMSNSPRRKPLFISRGSTRSPSHRNLGKSSTVRGIWNDRIRSRVLHETTSVS